MKDSIFFKISNQIDLLRKKGAFYIVIGSFLTKFVSFFASIFVVRLMTKTDYGILSYYENLYSFFLIAMGLGFSNGILRFVVLEDDVQNKQASFWFALKWGTVWNIIIFIFSLVFSCIYHHPSNFQSYNYILIILVFGMCFEFIITSCLSYHRANFDYKFYALFSLLFSICVILIRVLGAFLGSINGVAFSKVIVCMIFAIASLILIIKRTFESGFKKKFDLKKEKKQEMLKYSFQMMLIDGLWAIFMLNDLFVLGRMLGDELLIAQYKIAYVLPANLVILSSAINIFISPYFIKHDAEGDYGWIRLNYLKIITISCFVVIIIISFLFVFSNEILGLLFGQQYVVASSIMRVLLVASFFNVSIRSITANLLSSTGHQRYNLIVASVGIITQIILDCALINKYGVVGLPWAGVCVYIIMSILVVFFFINIYFVKGISKNGKSGKM